MKYLLDTNHANLLLARPALPRQKRMDVEFVLCTPILGELWYGVLNSERREENELDLLHLIRRVDILTFDASFVEAFGFIRVELKKAGRTIPQIDAQLAAIARVTGLPILTADRHLGFVSGLRLENWLA